MDLPNYIEYGWDHKHECREECGRGRAPLTRSLTRRLVRRGRQRRRPAQFQGGPSQGKGHDVVDAASTVAGMVVVDRRRRRRVEGADADPSSQRLQLARRRSQGGIDAPPADGGVRLLDGIR